jgi:hypothetical protein
MARYWFLKGAFISVGDNKNRGNGAFQIDFTLIFLGVWFSNENRMKYD